MRRVAGRLQTVGAGVLVLAVTVAAPALSAAQDSEAPAEPAPAAPTPPAEPSPPAGEVVPDTEGGEEQVASQAAVSATAPEPSAPPEQKAKASASKTVSVGDNFYSPATVSINAGDTVTWKNNGAAVHSATADDESFDTGVFDPGQSRSETFTTAGTIEYFCTVHGTAQSGTIRVLAASNGGGGGGGSGSSGGSEAAAVASPGAAGSSSSLPATGFAAMFLAAIGMALLGSGTALRRRELAREPGRKP